MPKPLSVQWKKEQLPQDLVDLRKHIEDLPWQFRQVLLPVCDRVCHFTRLQGRLVRIAQEAVDQLQLDVKYLLFDLEATRRERDAFRQESE